PTIRGAAVSSGRPHWRVGALCARLLTQETRAPTPDQHVTALPWPRRRGGPSQTGARARLARGADPDGVAGLRDPVPEPGGQPLCRGGIAEAGALLLRPRHRRLPRVRPVQRG